MDTNFERIAMYLKYELEPKTPQDISQWTGISLGDVYEILQENKTFFREILSNNGNSLEGWTIDKGYL